MVFLDVRDKTDMLLFMRLGLWEPNKKRKATSLQGFAFMIQYYGADSRIRTGDPILTMDVLYLLS